MLVDCIETGTMCFLGYVFLNYKVNLPFLYSWKISRKTETLQVNLLRISLNEKRQVNITASNK